MAWIINSPETAKAKCPDKHKYDTTVLRVKVICDITFTMHNGLEVIGRSAASECRIQWPRTIALAAGLLVTAAACQNADSPRSPEAAYITGPGTGTLGGPDMTSLLPTTEATASPETTVAVPPEPTPAAPEPPPPAPEEPQPSPTPSVKADRPNTAPPRPTQPRPPYDFEPDTQGEIYERYALEQLLEYNKAGFLERVQTGSGIRFDIYQTGLGKQTPITINHEVLDLYVHHAIDSAAGLDQSYIDRTKLYDLQKQAAAGKLTDFVIGVILSTDATQCLKDNHPDDYSFYTFMPGRSGADRDCLGLAGQTYWRYESERSFAAPIITSGTRVKLKSGAHEVRGKQGVTALAYAHEFFHAIVTYLAGPADGEAVAHLSAQELADKEHREFTDPLEARFLQTFAAAGSGDRVVTIQQVPFTFTE